VNSYFEHVKHDGLLGLLRQAVIFILLASPINVSANQAMAESTTIELDKVIVGNLITITPVVSYLSEGDYLYRMALVKTGRSGNSSSKQSGRFRVKDEGPARLSTTSINLGPADSCELTVTLIQEFKPILEKRFQCILHNN
jgi:hypothetical protein